jgi:hypothetical protein
MAVVTDAHTGFIKEEYVGPTMPDIALLGPTIGASVAVAAAEQAASRRGSASVRADPTVGYIFARLSPLRGRWPVTVANARHRRLSTLRTIAAGEEGISGSVSFREKPGIYILSAPRCKRRVLRVKARRTSSVILFCSKG